MGKSFGKKPGAVPPDGKVSHLGNSPQPSGLAPASPASAIILAVVLGLCLYLGWFLLQPVIPSQPAAGSRLSLLSTWLIPEVLIQNWTGQARSAAQGATLMDRWPILLLATTYLFAAWGLGSYLVKPLTNSVLLSTCERWIFGHALGLQALSLLTLAAGLVFHNFAITLAVRLLIACGIGLTIVSILRTRLQPTALSTNELSPPGTSPTPLWQFLAILAMAVPLFLAAMLPPSDFDVREYHLQVPKEWFQAGHISYLPHNIYGNMPLGAEMPCFATSHLAAGPLAWWWGSLAGKAIMAYHTLLTAFALYAFSQRAGYGRWSLLAAGIYLLNPWVFHVSSQGLNEGVYATYLFLAGYAFLLARGSAITPLFYSGLFAGAAASCKYPAVVFVVLPLLAATIFFDRLMGTSPAATIPVNHRRWRASLLFMTGTTVSAGLWYLKNWLLIGNPVFPLLGSLFPTAGRTPDQVAQWSHAHAPPGFSWSDFTNSLPAMLLHTELASPIVPALAALGLLAIAIYSSTNISPSDSKDSVPNNDWSRTSQRALLLWLCVVVILWWFCTHRLERFLVPIVSLLTLLSTYGIALAWKQGAIARCAISLLMVAGMLYSVTASFLLKGDNRWLVPLQELRVDAPLSDAAFSRTSAAHRWLNANTQPGKSVLLVGDAQPFDLEMPVLYNTCFDDCILVNLLEAGTPDEKLATLHQHNIQLVYIHQGELARYRSPGNYGYDPRLTDAFIDGLLQDQILTPVKHSPLNPPTPPGIYEVPLAAPRPEK